VLVTVILVKNSTSISYSYTIIFHVATRSILFLSLSLSLSHFASLATKSLFHNSFALTLHSLTRKEIFQIFHKQEKSKRKN